MRIAVLGAGAMGCLFGGYLSQRHDVWLIDSDRSKVDAILSSGVLIQEADGERLFHPNAVSDAASLEPMDLVIVLVKAVFSREALEKNRHLIDGKTYLLSLQNGAGHEKTLAEFAPPGRVVLGTTQHNSSLKMPGKIHHGGGGQTFIGLPDADSTPLEPLAAAFRECGIVTSVSPDINKQVWAKLFLNASASALTAILQVRLGFIVENSHAWLLANRLIREAVSVANAEGQNFDPDVVAVDIREILARARLGITSICADIRDGVRTEADTISGFVVRKAQQLEVPVPTHEFVLQCIHALEEKYENP